jgi:transcriptional regulator with XRE-family HTH domain
MNYQLIKTLCQKKGLTLEALAEDVGMSRTGLNTSLKNGTLKVDTLEKISKKLNVSPSHFFGSTEVDNIKQLIKQGIILNTQNLLESIIYENYPFIGQVLDRIWEEIPKQKRKDYMHERTKNLRNDLMEGEAVYLDTPTRLSYILDFFNNQEAQFRDELDEAIKFAAIHFVKHIIADKTICFVIKQELISEINFMADANKAFKNCFRVTPEELHKQLVLALKKLAEIEQK